MITIVRRIAVPHRDRLPTFLVRCSSCGQTYVRRGWAYDMKRTKSCSDCDLAGRKQPRRRDGRFLPDAARVE